MEINFTQTECSSYSIVISLIGRPYRTALQWCQRLFCTKGRSINRT